MAANAPRRAPLNLKAGEWVEVRTEDEILATLDARGRLENLPFMPEMLCFCGRRFRVSKRADKTCDNIGVWSMRRMRHAVLLDGARCDGAAHGDCQAGCMIFWNEAWLKRSSENCVSAEDLLPSRARPVPSPGACTRENLRAAAQSVAENNEIIYSCQATDVLKFTSYMAWWDPRQYIRDIRSGNLATGYSRGSLSERVLEFSLALLQVLRAFIMSFFTDFRHLNFPSTIGTLEKTSAETLDLQPGELVQVRTKEEIIATLDKSSRNRGLLFDGEMLAFCGGIFRVLRRVNRIIDEKTGRMMNMKHPCIILEGVYCKADFHRLCPRAIYSYWRENWLQRVSSDLSRATLQRDQEIETCQRP